MFQLMFRLYWLPQRQRDYLQLRPDAADESAAFFEKKRLLAAYAARKYPARSWRDGTAIEGTRYLAISALSVDTNPGVCSARKGGLCGIYERRPLACRTVPFHYSRAEALAERDLEAFARKPDYGCDTGDNADVVLEAGRIVDPEIRQARADALALAALDSRWNEAILRRMKLGASERAGLPSLREIEANARFGATTSTMRVAWEIAADAGLIAAEQYRSLVEAQLGAIDRELAAGTCGPDARQTLVEMRAEYRHRLDSRLPFAPGRIRA